MHDELDLVADDFSSRLTTPAFKVGIASPSCLPPTPTPSPTPERVYIPQHAHLFTPTPIPAFKAVLRKHRDNLALLFNFYSGADHSMQARVKVMDRDRVRDQGYGYDYGFASG